MQIFLILFKYQWEEQLIRLERKATTSVEAVKYPGVGTVASIAASPSSLLPSTAKAARHTAIPGPKSHIDAVYGKETGTESLCQ